MPGISEKRWDYREEEVTPFPIPFYENAKRKEVDEMRKSHSFDVLSDKSCVIPGCKRKIKERLKEQNDICYHHFTGKKMRRFVETQKKREEVV